MDFWTPKGKYTKAEWETCKDIRNLLFHCEFVTNHKVNTFEKKLANTFK